MPSEDTAFIILGRPMVAPTNISSTAVPHNRLPCLKGGGPPNGGGGIVKTSVRCINIKKGNCLTVLVRQSLFLSKSCFFDVIGIITVVLEII